MQWPKEKKYKRENNYRASSTNHTKNKGNVSSFQFISGQSPSPMFFSTMTTSR
jgi:hypothetical protein